MSADTASRVTDSLTRRRFGRAHLPLRPRRRLTQNPALPAGPRSALQAPPGTGKLARPDGAAYLYVGPWDDRRPGDAAFWNAPFGAVRALEEVGTVEGAAAFLREGLGRLSAG